MSKGSVKYWNAFAEQSRNRWKSLAGTDGMIEQITLGRDPDCGDLTRLTRFKAGADTTPFGSSCHQYPEEVFVVSGRLYDQACERWLEQGDYACRQPGEIHGPFLCEQECIVLEISSPGRIKA
ncbi:cupin domain-containing protein [Photobacterium atrarenae]|uniref:Cupin domain-containing protein n=1 Tax=Photobacterium atrarenae TaxID=865757 RepID=A0ABY5GLX1_9GAMM|nr:cupin domain-containing protein [Photobacterium atrarenae]UTV30136.1 cupin domain-containing protein [Photobacterium atrarenae]